MAAAADAMERPRTRLPIEAGERQAACGLNARRRSHGAGPAGLGFGHRTSRVPAAVALPGENGRRVPGGDAHGPTAPVVTEQPAGRLRMAGESTEYP